jgi:hypothetical protein
MDATSVGQLAADLMERIADEYPDECEVGVVALVLEVDIPPSDDEEEGSTEITYRCSDGRKWIQAGLFHRAVAIAEREE